MSKGVFTKMQILSRNLERHVHEKKNMHTLGCVFAHERTLFLFCLNLRPYISRKRVVRQSCKFTGWIFKKCLNTYRKPFSRAWRLTGSNYFINSLPKHKLNTKLTYQRLQWLCTTKTTDFNTELVQESKTQTNINSHLQQTLGIGIWSNFQSCHTILL